jgi:hypothetical protein
VSKLGLESSSGSCRADGLGKITGGGWLAFTGEIVLGRDPGRGNEG